MDGEGPNGAMLRKEEVSCPGQSPDANRPAARAELLPLAQGAEQPVRRMPWGWEAPARGDRARNAPRGPGYRCTRCHGAQLAPCSALPGGRQPWRVRARWARAPVSIPRLGQVRAPSLLPPGQALAPRGWAVRALCHGHLAPQPLSSDPETAGPGRMRTAAGWPPRCPGTAGRGMPAGALGPGEAADVRRRLLALPARAGGPVEPPVAGTGTGTTLQPSAPPSPAPEMGQLPCRAPHPLKLGLSRGAREQGAH